MINVVVVPDKRIREKRTTGLSLLKLTYIFDSLANFRVKYWNI